MTDPVIDALAQLGGGRGGQDERAFGQKCAFATVAILKANVEAIAAAVERTPVETLACAIVILARLAATPDPGLQPHDEDRPTTAH